MYTVEKVGSLYKVVADSGVVMFSSLDKGNCVRWIANAGETQEQKENRFAEMT